MENNQKFRTLTDIHQEYHHLKNTSRTCPFFIFTDEAKKRDADIKQKKLILKQEYDLHYANVQREFENMKKEIVLSIKGYVGEKKEAAIFLENLLNEHHFPQYRSW